MTQNILSERSTPIFIGLLDYYLNQHGKRSDFIVLPDAEIPMHSPHIRILKAKHIKEKDAKSFVVKLMRADSESYDKHPDMVFNDLLIQERLKRLGVQHREYMIYDDKGDNPLGIPCAVSKFINRKTLREEPKKLADVISSILKTLFTVHSNTIKEAFGRINISPKSEEPFSAFASRLLMRDIERDKIELNAKRKENLQRMISELDNINKFCLCHCDITDGNVLISNNSVTLIDWSYSSYTHPSFDFAHLLYLLLEANQSSLALRLMKESQNLYEKLGFDIVENILFFLVQRYIEVGRIKGKEKQAKYALDLLDLQAHFGWEKIFT